MVRVNSFTIFCGTFVILAIGPANCLIEFTNAKCETFDASKVTIEHCFLKSVNRTYKYVSMKAVILRKPVENFSVELQILKRSNGYKPFLFKTRMNDGCKFLANPGSNKIAKIILDLIIPYSNFNTTCPIVIDPFIEKLPISYLNRIVENGGLLPKGDFCLETIWRLDNKKQVITQVFFTFK